MVFDRIFTDEAFLAVLTDEFKPTKDIKKEVGCSHKLVARVLNRLVEEGKVERSQEPCAGRLGFRNVWKLRSEQG
jgi:predicted transcriptional regulator